LPIADRGAQRASSHRSPAIPIALVVAAVVAVGVLGVTPRGVVAATAPSSGVVAQANVTTAPTPSPTPAPTPAPMPTPTPSASPDPALDALAGAPAPSTTPTASPAAVEGATGPIVDSAARSTVPKVVVVVGPVGPNTRRYISRGRVIAAQARAYGAHVVEVFSPNATWARVREAAAGANVFVYLGHGNGWPSGHGPFDPATKNGLGLNQAAGRGNANTKYYGESIIARSLDLAPDAVVILNHLCYASGNNEWGRGNPRRGTAIARVDNYGAGFLRAGAAAVVADGLGSPAYLLRGLLRTERTIRQIFWSSEEASRSRVVSFASRRTPGARALMDPYAPGRYYRSVIGDLDFRASGWR